MTEKDESKSLDILGIKPVGDAISKLTTALVDGSAAFLSRICLPASEEFGLLLRDKVSSWRAANLVAMLENAEKKVADNNLDGLHAHPRIVSSILEEGSWIDDVVVQDMWAGLLYFDSAGVKSLHHPVDRWQPSYFSKADSAKEPGRCRPT